MPATTLKLFRQTHLYFGVFISPALLFFAFTGALQTFSLHETTRGSDYKPPAWIVDLGRLHKKQTLEVSVHKQRPDDPPKPHPAGPPAATPTATPPQPVAGKHHDRTDLLPPEQASPNFVPFVDDAPKPPAAAPAPALAQPKKHLPMKIFFLIVSIGLFTSTITGIYMAYKFNNNKSLVSGLLVAGVVVPLLLLPF